MFYAILLTIFSCIAVLDYILRRKRNLCFEKSKIYGPKSWPIIGCGLDLVHLTPEAIIPYFGRLFEKYGSTFRLWMLHEAHIYTTDVRILERILTSPTMLAKGDLYDLLRSWLNDGLLLSVGNKWRSRRKMFTPAFHFKVLDHFVEIFDRKSEIMAKKLMSHADGRQVVNIFDYVSLAALDSIAEAAMGVEVNSQMHPEFPYVQALKRVTYIQSDRLLKINQRYDFMFKLTCSRKFKELQQAIRTMHKFTNEVIENRRALLKRSIDAGNYKPLALADDEIGSKEQMAFLDILLQSSIPGSPPLTNQEICEEVDTFTFEGDDTTTSGISHALYCISRHPEVQQKLYDEIVSIFGSNKSAPISMGILQELTYLDCVIKEVLRLYPPVPAIGRRIDKDIQIDDGLTIPANTNVYIVTYFAHRNPKYFENPESFRPERFLGKEGDELKKYSTPFAYTPFSAGPRNCIGQRFALLEMKAIISKILRWYELLPIDIEVTPMMNFVLRSPHGMNLALRPRM